LKMKLEGIQAMVDEFDLNKRTGIDLPQEVISTTPSREQKAKSFPGDPEWKDIDTVYSSFGQGMDVLTPIALLRAHSAIGMAGKMYVPHLLKELRPVAEVGTDPGSPTTGRLVQQERLTGPNQSASYSQGPKRYGGESHVVGGQRSRHRNRHKNGWIRHRRQNRTAQVVSLGKDVGEHKDHSWFVSYAPAFKPEISVVALIENAGLGSRFGAPSVRAMYDVYYRKTRNEQPPGSLPVAKTAKPNTPTPKKPNTFIARIQ